MQTYINFLQYCNYSPKNKNIFVCLRNLPYVCSMEKPKIINLHLKGEQIDDLNAVSGHYEKILPNISQQDCIRMLLREKANELHNITKYDESNHSKQADG